MEEFKYDELEMQMRSLTFEIAKGQAMLNAVLLIGEWETMKKFYGFSDADYPAMAREVANAYQMIDKDSPAHKALFENPLTKLAVISQAPPGAEKEKSDPEKFPG